MSNMIPSASTSQATPCPICQALVLPAVTSYPFCSARCRQIDLGRWLRGDYKVSRPLAPQDLEDTSDESF